MASIVTNDEGFKNLHRGNLSDAKSQFLTSIMEHPESLDAYRGLALTHGELSEWIDAVDVLELAIELLQSISESDERVLFFTALQAAFALKAGDQAGARQNITLVRNAQRFAAGQGKGAQALQDLERIDSVLLELEEEASATPQENLGEAQIAALIADQNNLAKVLGFDDTMLRALYDRAVTLLEKKDFHAAAQVFDSLVCLEPKVPMFHLGLAASYEGLENFVNASKAYSRALQLAKSLSFNSEKVSADVLLRRATFHIDGMDFDEALQDIESLSALQESFDRDLTMRFALCCQDYDDEVVQSQNEEGVVP